MIASENAAAITGNNVHPLLLAPRPHFCDHRHIPAIDFPLIAPSRVKASVNPDTQTPTDWVQHHRGPTSTCLLLDTLFPRLAFFLYSLLVILLILFPFTFRVRHIGVGLYVFTLVKSSHFHQKFATNMLAASEMS